MTQTPSLQVTPQPGIMEIALYEAGSATLSGRSDVLKLSSNENPFGPSEKAREAVAHAAQAMHRYPSTDHARLRAAIGEVHGLDPDRIICGVGSDEIIHFLCQAYAGPGDEVIHTEHGFAMYRISALAAGATPVEVPERERTTDVDAILAAATSRTKLVFIANPNNPTGTMIGEGELARLADGLPQTGVVGIRITVQVPNRPEERLARGFGRAKRVLVGAELQDVGLALQMRLTALVKGDVHDAGLGGDPGH